MNNITELETSIKERTDRINTYRKQQNNLNKRINQLAILNQREKRELKKLKKKRYNE